MRHSKAEESAQRNKGSVGQGLELCWRPSRAQDSKMPSAASFWTVDSAADTAAPAFSVVWDGTALHPPSCKCGHDRLGPQSRVSVK